MFPQCRSILPRSFRKGKACSKQWSQLCRAHRAAVAETNGRFRAIEPASPAIYRDSKQPNGKQTVKLSPSFFRESPREIFVNRISLKNVARVREYSAPLARIGRIGQEKEWREKKGRGG